MKLTLIVFFFSLNLWATPSFFLKEDQIKSYSTCLDSFRNYGATESFTLPIRPNRTLLMIPNGSQGIYIYPSDGPAFLSPLSNVNWKHGARNQLYFYTRGNERKYTEYLIHYETTATGHGFFTDKTLYLKEVSSQKKFLLDRVMNSKPLKEIDRGINYELLKTRIEEISSDKRETAKIDEKPLLNELKRLLDKMDKGTHSRYSKRQFEMNFDKSCADVSVEAKKILHEYKTKLDQKPDLEFRQISIEPNSEAEKE